MNPNAAMAASRHSNSYVVTASVDYIDFKNAVNLGEIVMLKSGSVHMTVESLRKDGRVVCVWFDRRQKICRGAFPSAALKAVQRGS